MLAERSGTCGFEYVTIKTLEVLDFALLASALLLDDSVLWSSCLDKSLEGSHCFLRCCGCASHTELAMCKSSIVSDCDDYFL